MINWYQTIPELGIKGRIDTPEEFDKIGLPRSLTGWSVLDIGCNSGAYMAECLRRYAMNVVGVEPDIEWRLLAIGILTELKFGDALWRIRSNLKYVGDHFDLVLLLSVTHVAVGMTGQELIDRAWARTQKMLIIEINDRLQKEKLTLPKEVKLYGTAKDGRSVYHCTKSNG